MFAHGSVLCGVSPWERVCAFIPTHEYTLWVPGALAAAGTTGIMAGALRAYDPDATGCVALDAFLTAAARAGVTVQPGG